MRASNQAAQPARIEEGIHYGKHLYTQAQRVVVATDAAKRLQPWAGVDELLQRGRFTKVIWPTPEAPPPLSGSS